MSIEWPAAAELSLQALQVIDQALAADERAFLERLSQRYRNDPS